MALAAGRLRHRITVQRQAESRDTTSGAVNVNWVDYAELWAAVEPVSVLGFIAAREFIAGQSMQSQIVARIVVRQRDDLTAKMRILFRGRIYNPQGWLPDPESGLEYMTSPCTEGVNDGR